MRLTHGGYSVPHGASGPTLLVEVPSAMERFDSAADLVAARKPERPVLCARPHAAARSARWFLDNFPGDVAYAYKANSSVFLIGALYGAGIRHFDVASSVEVDDAATIPAAHLHFMNPVKSREVDPQGLPRARHQELLARYRGRAEEDRRRDRGRRRARRAIWCCSCASPCRPSTAAFRWSASSVLRGRRRRGCW